MSTFVPSKSRSTAEAVADFCRRTDLARAAITDMPGIGAAGETGLANNSITQITQLFGQFLLLDNGARDCQEVCDAMMEVSPPLFFLFLSLLFHIYFFMVDSTSFSFFSTNFLLLLCCSLFFFFFFVFFRRHYSGSMITVSVVHMVTLLCFALQTISMRNNCLPTTLMNKQC